MAKLTKIQLNFIKKMEINVEDLFDASDLKSSEWKRQMKELGKLVAFGVTPCIAKGHSLRTRAGHCIQCNTAVLAYHRRYSDAGDVYVAWSQNGQMAKIGCAKNAYLRLESLIEAGYGGQRDWTLKLIYECLEAGAIENTAHDSLRRYALKGITYLRDGVQQECTELFKCTLRQAKAALEKGVKML